MTVSSPPFAFCGPWATCRHLGEGVVVEGPSSERAKRRGSPAAALYLQIVGGDGVEARVILCQRGKSCAGTTRARATIEWAVNANLELICTTVGS